MKTNILNIIIILFLFGCNSSKQKQTTKVTPVPVDPTSLGVDLSKVKDLQVNRIPHPFNLDGRIPFAVWADGKKLNLQPKQTIELAKYLGIQFEQPANTAEIHNGEGWQYPYPTTMQPNPAQANMPQIFQKVVR